MTTKLRSASRFGARYGSPLKQVVADIERVQKNKQTCPRCGRRSLKRRGYSRWECTKCRASIAGGAYAPQTDLGRIVEKTLRKELAPEELKKAVEAEAPLAKPVRSMKKSKKQKKKELSPQEQEFQVEEPKEEQGIEVV